MLLIHYYIATNMPHIISAHTEDIELIRQLAMQVWPQTYAPIIGEQQVSYMLDRFYAPAALQKQLADGDSFIICYDNELPVAFASYGKVAPHIFKLHKLYILPGLQGRGIGSHMIAYIKDAVKKLKGTQLQLNVNRYNDKAKLFYERSGFTLLRDEDIDIGNGFFMNDHVLSLRLD